MDRMPPVQLPRARETRDGFLDKLDIRRVFAHVVKSCHKALVSPACQFSLRGTRGLFLLAPQYLLFLFSQLGDTARNIATLIETAVVAQNPLDRELCQLAKRSQRLRHIRGDRFCGSHETPANDSERVRCKQQVPPAPRIGRYGLAYVQEYG